MVLTSRWLCHVHHLYPSPRETDLNHIPKHCPNRPNCTIAICTNGFQWDSWQKQNCPTNKTVPNFGRGMPQARGFHVPPARGEWKRRRQATPASRRRSCELHHGKPSFHAGYPPQHATARGGGASDTPPLYPALGKQPHERLYPPSERCFVSEWGFHLAGKTGLRLAIFDGRKFAHSSFCGCTLQPTCNKLNSEGTEHPPPPFPPA